MASAAVSNIEVARNQYAHYQRARDNGHETFVKMAEKCDKYYWGDQWDAAVKAQLESEGRPYLTINTILSTINVICGEQSRTRADIQFKPRKDGAAEVATALTQVVDQITYNNHMDWLEGRVFADGVILGRGYFDVRIDFSENIQGEVKITSEDPYDILLDPDAKEYDPKTWKEVTKTRWLALDDIEALYGEEKADELRGSGGVAFGHDSIVYEPRFSDNPWPATDVTNIDDGGEDKTIRRVRVIERQYRKLRQVRMFVDNKTGDMREIPASWDKPRVAQLAQTYGLSVITKLTHAIRWTVSADNVLLHDDWSPYKEFTIVPYFAYFRRGHPFGVVENLLSPQDQLNKVSSQELHVVNTTANSGWIFESGTLVNMTGDDLRSNGSKTGLVLEIARGAQPPEKIKPNQIPTGLDRISSKAMANIKEISGVSDSLLGYDSAEVSGVAINAKQSRGLIQMQVPFDNLARTRHLVAERILDLVQQFYTEERMLLVTDHADPNQPPQQVTVNQMTPEGEILNDLTLGTYDVVVTSAPARDTFMESQFAEALSMRSAGVMIPDDAIVEYSNLEKKHQLAERMRQEQGHGQPSPEEQQVQQMQLQAGIQRMQLELKEMDATIAQIESQANLNNAKAAQLGGGAQPGEAEGVQHAQDARQAELDHILELKKLHQDRQNLLDTLANQLEIARMNDQTKQSQFEQQRKQRNEQAQASKNGQRKDRKGLAR